MTSKLQDIYAETLAVFDRREFRNEPLTTPEVADALDAERRTVYERLRKLADRGKLETKEAGANSRVWWRPPADSSAACTGSGGESKPLPGERDRDVEQRSRAMESVIDGVAIVDEAGEYRYVNQPHVEVYGYDDAEAFLGEHWRMCYQEEELSRFEDDIIPALYEEGSWRGETTGKRKDGTTFPQELSLTVADDGGIVCVVRDITDRKEHERRLRDARQFNEELVENAPFGMFRLDDELRITYENPRAEEIIGLPDEKDSSDAIGTDISKLPPIVETGQADLFTSLQDGETIEFAFPFESIYGKEAYFTGRAVPVYRDGEFDGAILMATDISERRQYERELERQREQLAALDELNDVVRGITEAVIEQSTRDEIEQVVCDRLAESDSYRFAWIGAIDSDLQLETRAEVGIDGYLDELSHSPAPDDPTDQDPTARAVHTQEIQIIQNALEVSDETLRDHAREFEYRSSAVIPIVHQGVLYGILGVCSERPDAFAEEEREVIGQLGDVVGHAIAAVDRKRALMSNEVVELEIRIPKLLEPRDDSVTTDEPVTIDRVTPLGDDEHLMYGTATGDAVEVIDALCEQLPNWKDVRTFDETGSEVRFEGRLSDAPITSIVADHGGNFKRGRIEDGAYSVTVQIPPGMDVRRVVDTIRETHPNVRVIRQRQVSRRDPLSQQSLNSLAEDLTERQRVALEAGYFGGFFDWPRHRSGEEVADSIGIGASTYHQHVRKAEKKLLDVVFTEL
ncbi:bacterio-opsin activator domain-containing protein [Salinirarus marinus]|uniref:bacterio-opsin activator domain-containing protein n=1 Tax=Salinirarus marinus TaxID=3068310 RepID=UPI003C6BE114